MRTEHDFIGSMDLPAEYPYGIHTRRAELNFPLSKERIRSDLFFALIQVKQSCARANCDAGLLDPEKAQYIDRACTNILSEIDSYIPSIHPLQGGAGTSTNMAANELVANIALKESGRVYGDYDFISPLTHVNMSQSTNDVYPTAVKIAMIRSSLRLHSSCEALLSALQSKEKEFAHILKIGRTEMQEAVPLSLGQEFGAYAEAVSRFRWRLSKAKEWIRDVNISGTAIGTGVNADRRYAAAVIGHLRGIVQENISLSRNLIDATQNIDQIVEFSALVRTGAVTVKKICSDLRFLSSGPRAGIGELILPHMQAGSSIMPGKVNPVILESVEQVCLSVMGSDAVVAIAASESSLELPQFLPLVAHTILSHNEMFASALAMLSSHVAGIIADEAAIRAHCNNSAAIATLLSPVIGYEAAAECVAQSEKDRRPVSDVMIERGLITREELDRFMKPDILASSGHIDFEKGRR